MASGNLYDGFGSMIRTEHLFYSVIYEYTPRRGDELRVRFLDEVQVIREIPGHDMWECSSQTRNIRGYVPVECLTPTFLHESFYRNCDRQGTEELMRSAPVGTYLIRPSGRTMFALSLKTALGIKNYGIKHVKGMNGGFHIDGDYKKFNTLQDLVANFRRNRDQMATDLLYPIGGLRREPVSWRPFNF